MTSIYSDMPCAYHRYYLDGLDRMLGRAFARAEEEVLNHKLFYARKLKSVFEEQKRLRKHLVQIADLEWGLKQHYFIFGDEYKTSRLNDRYKSLQIRIRQMKEENTYLQNRTEQQLRRYMFAQAAVNECLEEGHVPTPMNYDLHAGLDRIHLRDDSRSFLFKSTIGNGFDMAYSNASDSEDCIQAGLVSKMNPFNSNHNIKEDTSFLLNHVDAGNSAYRHGHPSESMFQPISNSSLPNDVINRSDIVTAVSSSKAAVMMTEASVQVTPEDLDTLTSGKKHTLGKPVEQNEVIPRTTLIETQLDAIPETTLIQAKVSPRSHSEIQHGGIVSRTSDLSTKSASIAEAKDSSVTGQDKNGKMSMMSRIVDDFKENLNNRQQQSRDEGRPVPDWADQIVEGLKRNVSQQNYQKLSTAPNMENIISIQKSPAEVQPDVRTSITSLESTLLLKNMNEIKSQESGMVRKKKLTPKRSRIPVRYPLKTLWYTSDKKEHVLRNVQRCMEGERKFKINSVYKKYCKK